MDRLADRAGVLVCPRHAKYWVCKVTKPEGPSKLPCPTASKAELTWPS